MSNQTGGLIRHCLNFKLPRPGMASASTSVGQAEDWDRPFTDEELQAIDAAFSSADVTTASPTSSSPIKDRRLTTVVSVDSHSKTRRRLPDSLFIFQQQNASSFSLSPCNRNRLHFYNPYRSYASSFYRGRLRMKYQDLAFKGRTVYSRTIDEVEKSAEELLNFIEKKKEKEGQVVLGFDIEWKPTFTRGLSPGKAAVMQICGDNSLCYVLHICHTGIPQILQNLLQNLTSVKVGVCIANDASKIFRDHNVSVRPLEDLSDLANTKLGGCRKWSLSALTEMLICKQGLRFWSGHLRMPVDYSDVFQLPKFGKIRCGNWEADILSEEQIQYAATDAFVSWYLYQVLKSLPEAATNKCEVPEAEE